MKRFLLALSITMLTQLSCFAQSKDRSEAVGNRIEAARAAYITERLALTPDEAEQFWPIYHEFSTKRSAIQHQLRNARKESIDDDALLALGFALKQEELDLEKEYTTRMAKVISAKKIVDLRVAESDFKKLVLRQIQQRRAQQDTRKERHIDR